MMPQQTVCWAAEIDAQQLKLHEWIAGSGCWCLCCVVLRQAAPWQRTEWASQLQVLQYWGWGGQVTQQVVFIDASACTFSHSVKHFEVKLRLLKLQHEHSKYTGVGVQNCPEVATGTDQSDLV
jgi:hypothetical protein